jgi:hypothetical protein
MFTSFKVDEFSLRVKLACAMAPVVTVTPNKAGFKRVQTGFYPRNSVQAVIVGNGADVSAFNGNTYPGSRVAVRRFYGATYSACLGECCAGIKQNENKKVTYV